MNSLDLELQELNEKRQMRNLANAVKLADSFSLLFVRCNQRPRQKEIIEELKDQLAEYKIKVIFLENQVEHLLDELQERLGDEKPDAVFVYGLESSFPKAATAAESKFVVTLNHSRNSFKRVLHCPLVLFLPEYALSAIYHGATDFYSIRSGVFLFSAKAEETEQLILEYTSQEYIESAALLFEERQNQIKTIKELLTEYESLPDSQRNLDIEYDLKNKLADLYDISAEYGRAESLYQDGIKHAQQNENTNLLLDCLNGLASVYKNTGRYDKATKLLEEVLEMDRKIIGAKHPNYATALNNLAAVYTAQNIYDKAIELYEKALDIDKETIGTKHPNYASRLNNLALVYRKQGRYSEAINLYKKALDIDKEVIGVKHPYYANHLNNLSRVYYEQERYREALVLVEEVYQIRLKTLGRNHPVTEDAKQGIEMNRTKIKEKAKLLIPYKN